MMQRIWNEKTHLKAKLEEFNIYFKTHRTKDQVRYGRALRRHYQNLDQLPNQIMAKIEQKK